MFHLSPFNNFCNATKSLNYPMTTSTEMTIFNDIKPNCKEESGNSKFCQKCSVATSKNPIKIPQPKSPADAKQKHPNTKNIKISPIGSKNNSQKTEKQSSSPLKAISMSSITIIQGKAVFPIVGILWLHQDTRDSIHTIALKPIITSSKSKSTKHTLRDGLTLSSITISSNKKLSLQIIKNLKQCLHKQGTN